MICIATSMTMPSFAQALGIIFPTKSICVSLARRRTSMPIGDVRYPSPATDAELAC